MTRVQNTPPIGGPTVLLDTDVPWPRTPPEIEREWQRAATYVVDIDPEQPWAELTGLERRSYGAWRTALWCRGQVDTSPVRGIAGPVTGQGIRDELVVAEAVMEGRGDGWEYALGALMWLLWVTGASDHMPYPVDRGRLTHR
jgi:hypothetical protein